MAHNVKKDVFFMEAALDMARLAQAQGEVPVGAVLVFPDTGKMVKAKNSVIELSDPTAHAEILALREACRMAANYRLPGTVLYCTMEPCLMCMGAAIHARVERVVFGAPDLKWGAAGSLYKFDADERLNHHPQVVSGVCEEACRDLIQNFFQKKREKPSAGGDGAYTRAQMA